MSTQFVSEADRAAVAIGSHAKALSQYVGTDVFGLVIGLLDALKVSYMHDLVDVTKDGLEVKQGALRQVMAIRASLENGGITSPKV